MIAAQEPRISNRLPTRDGIRETLDSMIVAFILAFVFRAFVVEAFVIPTGSMAPTLYGAHGQHRCRNCGYSFAFGLQEDAVARRFLVSCPNCNNERDAIEGDRLPLLASSGDRILVMKWPFDFGGAVLGPRRWDVVVFKDPNDCKQNFIKRLVGLPGEIIEIIDGDVYTADASKISDRLRTKLLADPEGPGGRDLSDADLVELGSHQRIARKPEESQSDLWMLHYDHDFPPIEVFRDSPEWFAGGPASETGWDAKTPIVTFDGRAGEHLLELRGKPVADLYAYNNDLQDGARRHALRSVGDLRLRFTLTPESPEGSLSVYLSKGTDEFRLTFKPDGEATLSHRVQGAATAWRQVTAQRRAGLRPERPVRIEVSNIDYRVSLRIDDQEWLVTTDRQYGPDLAALRKRSEGGGPPTRLAIAAEGWALTLRHLVVERDVYYRHVGGPGSYMPDDPFAARGLPGGWGTVGNPILLRDGEYFVCGDNSPASKDSRLWWEPCEFLKARGPDYQRGTVPADQMIGRAFFVYWPAGHGLSERGFRIIPNLGRVRLIR